MTKRFDECLRFVLRWEGGFSNHPADRGGATNKGITQVVYDSWRRKKGLPTRSARYITDDEVRRIYYERYWLPSKASECAPPLDLVIFDTAVNMGVGAVWLLLRRVANEVLRAGLAEAMRPLPDNIWKDLRLKRSPVVVAAKLWEQRAVRYRRIIQNNPAQRVFARGWWNRLKDLAKAAGLNVDLSKFNFSDQ